MFKQAFFWLYSHTTDFSLLYLPVTLTACSQAIHAALEEGEQALKNYRGLKYAQHQNTEQIQRALSEVQQSERYVAFLRKCEAALQDLRPRSLYELMLIIALPDSSLRAQVSPIFVTWLTQDATSALEYYDRYFESGRRKVSVDSPESEMFFLRGKRFVEDYLAQLRHALQYQENPLAICRLLSSVSDNVVQYTAFIIWMLERGATVDELIHSGILQRFLGYHFNSLHSDDYEEPLPTVVLLYGLLQRFDCAISLVDYARQISCGIRGHSIYNLLGQQHESLRLVECVTELPLLTRAVANIKQIINVFGQDGLSESVHTLFYLTKNNPLDDSFQRSLVEFVRETPSLMTPSLIQQIAQVNIMDLPKWILLIDERLFQQWIDNNELAVIYLVPHKPLWLGQMTLSKLRVFLDLIKNAYPFGGEVENIQLLSCLYRIASSSEPQMAELVYEEILDLTLKHRYLLEDVALSRLLRLSSYAEKYVGIKVSALIKALDEKIQAFFSELPIVSSHNRPVNHSDDVDVFILPGDCDRILPINANFSCLVSEWSGLVSQIEVLQQLSHGKKFNFPKREIDLIVYLFQQYSLQESSSWGELIQALALGDMDSLAFNERSRQVLLSILTSIDNEQLRQMIICLLNVDRTCLSKAFLLDAIHVGNQGLLDWYLQGANLEFQFFEEAMARKQWLMMAHWMENYQLPEFPKSFINQLLVAASGAHHLRLLRCVIDSFKGSFPIRSIAHAVRVASQQDDDKALYYLYALQPTPMALKVAFAQTTDNQHPHALSFFIGIKKPKSNLKDEMQRAFNVAVKKNDLNLVSKLTQCAANGPPRKVIQLAMENATDRQQTEMVKLLNGILHPSPSVTSNAPQQKVNAEQSFVSTDSLTHLSLFSSPIEAEPSQSTQFGRESITPL